MNLRAIRLLSCWLASAWALTIESIRCLIRPTELCSAVFLAVNIILTSTAFAVSASASGVCDKAAHQAAMEFGVPFPVLWSITRTETGRAQNGQLTPWPWTVNMEGKGQWFETRNGALDYIEREFERGARSFDVGCFQINYKWHGASFRSIDQMFDPLENARYAAAFLARLYRESGDWSVAAGAYHSRTPEFSKLYRARFDQIRKKYDPNGRPWPEAAPKNKRQYALKAAPERENTYPLLMHADTPARNGSLVPINNTQARALFVIPDIAEES